MTEAIGAFAHLIPKPGSGHSPRTVLPIFNTNNFPKINFSSSKPNGFYRVADKSLVRPGRKQSTATKLELLQATQKQFRRFSVQPGFWGNKYLRVVRKIATFQFFFQSGRAKDLSAPLYIVYKKKICFTLKLHIVLTVPEVLTTMFLKIQVFGDVTLCQLVNTCRTFRSIAVFGT